MRPTVDARVSAPLAWEEITDCEPGDFTLRSMPERFAAIGDRHAGIDEARCSLEALLELSARHEREGQGDAPWPPQYRKQPGEPARVQPSRRRVPSRPLIEIGRAQRKEDAIAGLDRWRARHPESPWRAPPPGRPSDRPGQPSLFALPHSPCRLYLIFIQTGNG